MRKTRHKGNILLEIDGASALTDDEIEAVLDIAARNKREGLLTVLVDGAAPKAATVQVPLGITLHLTPVEMAIALSRLNDAKMHGEAAITFEYRRGQLVKRGHIRYLDGPDNRRFRLGGHRLRDL